MKDSRQLTQDQPKRAFEFAKSEKQWSAQKVMARLRNTTINHAELMASLRRELPSAPAALEAHMPLVDNGEEEGCESEEPDVDDPVSDGRHQASREGASMQRHAAVGRGHGQHGDINFNH